MLADISSNPPRPVGPVHPTGQTDRLHAADSTGQTGPTDRSDRSAQNRKAAHLALKCTTREVPNLRVSLHDLPPLCIPRMNLTQQGQKSTSGCPEIIVATNSEYTNTQQVLPVYWVYLAHIF